MSSIVLFNSEIHQLKKDLTTLTPNEKLELANKQVKLVERSYYVIPDYLVRKLSDEVKSEVEIKDVYELTDKPWYVKGI